MNIKYWDQALSGRIVIWTHSSLCADRWNQNLWRMIKDKVSYIFLQDDKFKLKFFNAWFFFPPIGRQDFIGMLKCKP